MNSRCSRKWGWKLKTANKIIRWVLAAIAVIRAIAFLGLVSSPDSKSQEAAGMSIAAALICGAIAAIMFYRARHEDVNLTPRSPTTTPRSPDSTKSSLDHEPESGLVGHVVNQDRPLENPAFLRPDNSSPAITGQEGVTEVANQPDRNWLIIVGTALAIVVVGIVIAVAISSGSSRTPNPGQSTASVTEAPISGISTTAPESKGNDNEPNKDSTCPVALPAEVSAKPLAALALKELIGTDGSLDLHTEDDKYDVGYYYSWSASFKYINKTDYCVSMIGVELELNHGGEVSKERHTIVLQPLLGPGQTTPAGVDLRIRSTPRSEDVALLGWHTYAAWGFRLPKEPASDATDAKPSNPSPARAKITPQLAQSTEVAESEKQAESLYKEKRYSEAHQLFDQVCASGNMKGCANLGEIYINGDGVVKDYTRAVSLFSKACDAGSAEGCNDLGYSYEHGLGVAQDYSRAMGLFSKACESGVGEGCSNLGFMYSNGIGVTKDDVRGIALFTKACDEGSTSGCGKIVWCTKYGVGCDNLTKGR